MSGSKRYAAALLVSVILATLLSPTTTASAACYSNKTSEKQFTSLMNRARQAADKGSLRLDPELSKAAIVHTKEMVNRNTLYHTPSTTLKRRVTNWVTLGENVGVGGSVSSLHQAFMASPAHKANILYGTFKHVGVGVITKDGRMWVTVIFEARNDPGSPLC